MKLNYIRQPAGSKLCGQSCVAMILGITLKESIQLIGHERGTRTKELAKVLQNNGIVCDSKLKRAKNNGYPFRALLKKNFYIDNKRIGYGHWMVCWNGKVYDPDPPPIFPENYDSKITAYLELSRTK